MNILEACEDPELFGPWFKDPETYQAWFAFLAALFGLPMTEEQAEIYRRHTGREELPGEPSEEAWLIIGRRGGKSFVMALVAVFLACFRDYRPFLAPGEMGTVMVIAADRRQARTIIRYAKALLTGVPMLSDMVTAERAEGVDLDNSVAIEVGTASFRTTRGYTYVAVLCDELAFWPSEDSAEPDFEILDAIRPGMATIPNAMLLCASSPHARRGALWEAYRQYWGQNGPILVWKAATREMNPTVRQSVIDRATERDAAKASAEYGAEFRRDIEAFVSREVVEACVTRGLESLPWQHRQKYFAFVDPSGGSNDSFTLAIAHREDTSVVLDVLMDKKPPFSPEQTIAEFCVVLKAYGLREVTGDRYGGEFPREHFRNRGIAYKIAEKPRSDLYRDLLPLMNSGQIRLLDNKHLQNQLIGLERRVYRGGKETIDHAPGGHDDLANAVAGVANCIAFVKQAPVAASGATRRN
ncbi:hypothetical protein [Rhizobium cremeum]|uniref:hypothetical protein n=1 Tax=Rhizobium cremeum TaxID=2813827 RepID=UPI0039E0E1DC